MIRRMLKTFLFRWNVCWVSASPKPTSMAKSECSVISGRILMRTGQTIFICSTDVPNTRRCVQFADNVEIVEIEANGLCLSCAPKPNDPEVVWYDGCAPGSNPKDLIDAKDKALILEGVVELMQANYNAPCGFYCDYYEDNDLIYCGLYCPGCWIDDDETNLDEVPEYIATPAPAGLRQWIVDTGSEQDLVDTERAVTLQKRINPALTPINLSTANGSICADKIADFSIGQLNEVVTPYVLPSTPAVLSVGQRCLEKGYDFVWRKNSAPYFVRPDGKAVILKLDGRVPYVDDQCEVIASESAMPVALAASDQMIGGVEGPSSSSGGRPSPDAALFPLRPDEAEPPEPEFDPELEDNPEVAEAPKPMSKRSKEMMMREAKSEEHLFTHRPKNPFCETCVRSKMQAPQARRRHGSSSVDKSIWRSCDC